MIITLSCFRGAWGKTPYNAAWMKRRALTVVSMYPEKGGYESQYNENLFLYGLGPAD